jgi:hypothetical protein
VDPLKYKTSNANTRLANKIAFSVRIEQREAKWIGYQEEKEWRGNYRENDALSVERFYVHVSSAPALFEFILRGIPHAFRQRCNYLIDERLPHAVGAVKLGHFLDRNRPFLPHQTLGGVLRLM